MKLKPCFSLTPHTGLDMLLFYPHSFSETKPNPPKRLNLCQIYTPITAMSHSPSRTETGVLGNGAFFATRGTYFTQAVRTGNTVGVPGTEVLARSVNRLIGGTLHLNRNEEPGSLNQCEQSLKELEFVKRARKSR